MFVLIPINNQNTTNNHLHPSNSKELFGTRNEFISTMDDKDSKS